MSLPEAKLSTLGCPLGMCKVGCICRIAFPVGGCMHWASGNTVPGVWSGVNAYAKVSTPSPFNFKLLVFQILE